MGDPAGLSGDEFDTRWRGRVVIVTGSSMGIGEAVARRFAARGASVLVNSTRSVEAGQAVADSLPDALYVQADMADERACRGLVDAALHRWGRLDVLVNNAGTGPVVPHDDFAGAPLDVWREVFAVNLFSLWTLTVAAAPALSEARGCIVNVTSLAGIRQLGSSIPYACSKAAANHLTELTARVLGPAVRVNAVAPGLVDTPRSATWETRRAEYNRVAPLQGSASAADVADAVLFVAEQPHMTGEILVIDGGYRLVR
jgi:ketoreductase RED2